MIDWVYPPVLVFFIDDDYGVAVLLTDDTAYVLVLHCYMLSLSLDLHSDHFICMRPCIGP